MKEINPREIKAQLVLGDISQAQIAKHIGVTRGAITQMLSDDVNAGWKTLNRVIRAYNELNDN